MPGCEDVGSGAEGFPPPRGEEGLCDKLGNKTRGAGHCYWGNCPASVAPGFLSPEGRGKGRRLEFLLEEQC